MAGYLFSKKVNKGLKNFYDYNMGKGALFFFF